MKRNVVVAVLCLCCLFPLERGAAQFVDVTAEIEMVVWSAAGANARISTIRCVVGTNSWQMEGGFVSNAWEADFSFYSSNGW